MLTKNSTNQELSNEINFDHGQAVVFAVEPTSNPDYTSVYVAQKVKTGASTNDVQALFLGWNNERIVRCIVNMKNSQMPVLEKQFGKIGSKTKLTGFGISVKESFVPAYSGQSPKVNPSTGEAIIRNGKTVYEHASLVSVADSGVSVIAETVATPVTNVFAGSTIE